MANVIDYISWRGDLSFHKAPVNEVDIVILSQVVMLDLSKSVLRTKPLTLKECAERYFKHTPKDKHLGFIIPADIAKLFEAMAESERFSSLLLLGYVEDIEFGGETETQFSALTVDAPDVKTRFVIFSGTDDTIVGWKENFNLIYKTPTQAQINSVKYLNGATEDFEGKIIVLGHSKGGHLAMYATAKCNEEVRKHVKRVYNLDGPGFPEGEEFEQLIKPIEKKVVSLLPQSSVVGRLFEHGGDYKIVHSEQKGLFQHDCFSWQVHRSSLVYQSGFEENSSGIRRGVKNVLASMDSAERERFVEGLFGLFTSTGITTLTELALNGKAVVKQYFKMDAEMRASLNRTTVKLFSDKHLRKCVFESVREFSKSGLMAEAKTAKSKGGINAQDVGLVAEDSKKTKQKKQKVKPEKQPKVKPEKQPKIKPVKAQKPKKEKAKEKTKKE